MIDELAFLVAKVRADRETILKAEIFLSENEHDMHEGVACYFKDMLEKKKDRLSYEQHRIKRMGWAIGAGRDHRRIDI